MNNGPYGLPPSPKPAPLVKDPQAVKYIEELIAQASSGVNANDIADKLRGLIRVPPIVSLNNTPMEASGYGEDVVYTLDIGEQSEQHRVEFGLSKSERASASSPDWVAELYIRRDEHDSRYCTPKHGTTSDISIKVERHFFDNQTPEKAIKLFKLSIPSIRKALDDFEKAIK